MEILSPREKLMLLSRIGAYLLSVFVTFLLVDLITTPVLDFRDIGGWRVTGYMIAMRLSFIASVLLSLLFVLRSNFQILRGRILPPYKNYSTTKSPVASEYSLEMKYKVVKVSLIISLLASLISLEVLPYAVNTDPFQNVVIPYVEGDEPTKLSFLLPEPVIATLRMSEEGSKFLKIIAVFTVLVPSLPLIVLFYNMNSYLYERFRANFTYKAIVYTEE